MRCAYGISIGYLPGWDRWRIVGFLVGWCVLVFAGAVAGGDRVGWGGWR